MALTKTDSTAPSVVTLMPAVGSREVTARIDEANVSHIIGRLTKLYNNPVHATVRETVSNATDATRALPEHLRKPVEITTPNFLQKSFVVRDHGVGMSEEDVANVFANYGASTKGEDVKVIGSYGLGGKAPLAYTTAFEVTTTKNGITTSFTMTRSGGETKTSILSVERTGLDSGTEVRIPVESQDITGFEQAILFYKMHSHSGSVMIDGELYSGNSEYYHAGLVTLYEDQDGPVTGNAYLSKSTLEGYIYSYCNKSVDLHEISYSLGGWLYSADGTSRISYEPRIVIEVVPALVNFGSSRDAITADDKLNALNTRVLSAVYSDAFVEASLAEVRKLERKALAKFARAHQHNVSVADDGKTFTLSNHYNSYSSPSYTGPVELIESDLGFNPFLIDSSKNGGSGTLAFTKGAQDQLSYFYMVNQSSGNSEVKNEKTSKTSQLVLQFGREDLRGELSLTKLAAKYMGDEVPIVVVTSTTEASFKKLLRQRKALFAGQRGSFMFFFTHRPESKLDKADLETAKKVSGEKLVTLLKADELIELIRPDVEFQAKTRKLERSSQDSVILTKPRFFTSPRTKDGAKDVASIAAAYPARSNVNSFQEAIDLNAVLILSRDWRSAYIGALNAGIDLKDRPVLIYDRTLSAAEATQLMPHKDRVYFSSATALNSAAAQALAKDNIYSGSVLKSVLSSLPFEKLVAGVIGYLYPSMDYRALKFMKQYFDQKDKVFMKVYDVMADETNNSGGVTAQDAVEELTTRFGVEYVVAANQLKLGLSDALHSHTIESQLVSLILSNPRKGDFEVTPPVEAVLRCAAEMIVKGRVAAQS
jgi:hypothetical protein